jgi:glycosyltransferase involved in cell wall biosynthesis
MTMMLDWLFHSKRIYHVLWGENGYRYLGFMKRIKRGNKIVCSFHLPPDKFMEICRVTHHLTRLDAIIVLARHLIDFFSQFIPQERIFHIPYGVDTDFFCPPQDPSLPAKGPTTCLFVGQFLRDFDTLKAVIEQVNKLDKDISFVLATPPEKHRMFQGLNNIKLLWGAGNEQLKALYRNAALLLIPMEDAVANTAIVEAMACGLPMVLSDVGGVRDYVTEKFAVLCKKGDSSAMANAVIGLCAARRRRSAMAESARKHALQFDWKVIAGKIQEVYREIIVR